MENENSPLPDRSKVQSVYPSVAPPQPAQPPQAPLPANRPAADAGGTFQQASADFTDAAVIVTGVLSATSFIVVAYFAKNETVAGVISMLLALTAMVLGVRGYRTRKQMTPLVVIGLSAATFTLLYAAIILIARAMVHSIPYYY